MKKIGIIGLGVMGKSIARNFAGKGFEVIGYNRSIEKSQELDEIKTVAKMEELITNLDHPRHLLLMVPAGKVVDEVMDQLLPKLQEGDVIIDGGNSYFEDTQRRQDRCLQHGIVFMGLGISGGEQGALLGPSMMLGGDRTRAGEILPFLEKVAAAKPAPCVDYMGEGGAGHFVKMVHNGIEYAEMEAIAEIYTLVKDLYLLETKEIVGLFETLNKGVLSSYLLEITVNILKHRDDLSQGLLLDKISDVAGSKGTGRWTVETAFRWGVPISTISAALEMRTISSLTDLRRGFQNRYAHKREGVGVNVNSTADVMTKLLFFSKMVIYEQGLNLLMRAKRIKGYSYQISDVLKVWRDGCIIRSSLLDQMSRAMEAEESLLLDFEISKAIERDIDAVRKVLTVALEQGIALPVINNAYSYFEMLRSKTLPTRLIQAQRDYFGAHTYERIDQPGIFHTDWEARKC